MSVSAGRALSRRRLLAGGIASTGALLLAGCGGSVFAGSNRVRYWNLFGGGDGVRMVEMQDAYRKENPKVDLEAVTLAWGAPYYTKLAMASAGGRAPDVSVLHLSRLAGYAPGRLLDPFDLDLLAEFDVRPEDFPQGLWERATIDGKTYALPLDTHALVLYVNRELGKQVGFLDDQDQLVGLSSPEDFYAALDELNKATGEVGLGTGSDPATWWRYFWTFYRQLGGDMQLPVGERVIFDRDKFTQAIEFWLGILDKKRGSASADMGASIGTFVEGKMGMILNGNWELPTMLTAQEETGKPDFTMVQVPALFGSEPLGWADSHSLVLPHQNSRTKEQDRLSYGFIASLLKNGLIWAGGGHVPAYQPVATGQDYLNSKPQANYRQAAEVAQLDPVAWFTGAGSDFQNQIGQALDAVFNRTITPDQGINQFEAAMNKLLNTPSPV